MVLKEKAAVTRGKLPVNASNISEHKHSVHSLRAIPAKMIHQKPQPLAVSKRRVTLAVSAMAHPSLAAKAMLVTSRDMNTSWYN